MLFNSYEFLFFFLPLVWIGFELLGRAGKSRLGIAWLVLASGIFYATWNAMLLLLLVGSLVVNFLIGRLLNDGFAAAGKSSRPLLVIGLVFNLGLLGYFKYANFLVDNFNAGFGTDAFLSHIILPI